MAGRRLDLHSLLSELPEDDALSTPYLDSYDNTGKLGLPDKDDAVEEQVISASEGAKEDELAEQADDRQEIDEDVQASLMQDSPGEPEVDAEVDARAAEHTVDPATPRAASGPGGGSSGADTVVSVSVQASANSAPAGDAASAQSESSAPTAEHHLPVASTSGTDTHSEAVSTTTNQRKLKKAKKRVDVKLPTEAFKISEGAGSPQVRGMPDELLGRVREQIRAQAVRDMGASDDEAMKFAQRLSQSSIVVALLMAQFDVQVQCDPSTTLAARLLRSRDPLLGVVAQRLEALEERELVRQKSFDKLRETNRSMDEVLRSVEVGLAFTIADRFEHLVRGGGLAKDAEFDHHSARNVRERLRSLAHSDIRRENEQRGRPLR